jgi:ATP synthase I chain
MLADFPVLYVDLIVRRTIVSCIALAVVAVVVGFVVGQPLAGAGALLGLAAATVNHRIFQVSTVRYSKDDGHMDRRPYVGTVAARLGGITVVAFALLFLVRPMGFGMIGGLVAFQLMLMANALGALWRYQRLQLAGVGPVASGGSGGGDNGATPLAQVELPGTSVPGEVEANG